VNSAEDAQDLVIRLVCGEELQKRLREGMLKSGLPEKMADSVIKAFLDEASGRLSFDVRAGGKMTRPEVKPAWDKALERATADYLGFEDAILFAAAFDANGGIFEPLFGAEDAIVSDSLNHASIIDGVRLCKAKRYRFANSDMDDLETQLKQARADGAREIVIATDGVFSMDGYIAKLKDIRALADKYGALIMVDDCHATGFLGPRGRGSYAHHGVEIDFLTGTFGKALGGAMGGFICATAIWRRRWRRSRARCRRRAAPARDEWTVRGQEGVPDRAQEREARLEAQGVEVIEEQSSDASGLLPVLEQEILVALPLEAGIEIVPEGLDRRAGGLVPVDRVLLETVVRSQVKPAPEPPNGRRSVLRLAGGEEAHVGMAGRDVGIAGVEDERDPDRRPGSSRQLGAVLGGGGREAQSVDAREGHACFFEESSVREHAGTSSSALRAGPRILDKAGRTVVCRERRADAVLQRGQVLFNGGQGGGHDGESGSRTRKAHGWQ
jgi:hypothetical protein